MNFSSEDVYDPQAIMLANSVYDICEKMGMPECIYLAQHAMHQDIREFGTLPVPMHIRNAPTKLMKEVGYGAGYEYAHNLESKKSSQEHFPEELKGRKYRT